MGSKADVADLMAACPCGRRQLLSAFGEDVSVDHLLRAFVEVNKLLRYLGLFRFIISDVTDKMNRIRAERADPFGLATVSQCRRCAVVVRSTSSTLQTSIGCWPHPARKFGCGR